MELIKQIKQAEAQGQQIIDKANTDAADLAEKAKQNQSRQLAEAEKQRAEAIQKAVEDAQADAAAEIEKLKDHAQQNRSKLRDSATAKMPQAVTKVMEYLKTNS